MAERAGRAAGGNLFMAAAHAEVPPLKKAVNYLIVCVVVVGVVFCLLSHGDLRLIVGVGTICNALFNGPLIQFFKTHAAEPIMGRKTN